MTTRKQHRLLAQRMARSFLAAGPLGSGVRGESLDGVAGPMLQTVVRQFPEADVGDFEEMCREIGRMTDRGPSWQRLGEALLLRYLEKLATEFLEAEVRDGKSVREVDPVTGEVFYRRIR